VCARLLEIYRRNRFLGAYLLGEDALGAERLLHQLEGLFFLAFALEELGELRVHLDEVAGPVPPFEQLDRKLVQLLGSGDVAEVGEDVTQDSL
jgi:hypothetical protein